MGYDVSAPTRRILWTELGFDIANVPYVLFSELNESDIRETRSKCRYLMTLIGSITHLDKTLSLFGHTTIARLNLNLGELERYWKNYWKNTQRKIGANSLLDYDRMSSMGPISSYSFMRYFDDMEQQYKSTPMRHQRIHVVPTF